jgi:hypothetical protein
LARLMPIFDDLSANARRKMRRALGYIEAVRGYPALKRKFQQRVGYALNLSSPRTFNEKMQVRKLFDRNPLFPVISDKLRMRDHVAQVLGAERARSLLPTLLGVTEFPDELWISRFGTNVAFKANHGSGYNLFLRTGESVDAKTISRTCERWLRQDYGLKKLEWGYRPIPRRIMAEELIVGPDGRLADDLKFTMFDGNCAMIGLEWDRFGTHTQAVFDENWVRLPVKCKHDALDQNPPRPRELDRMLGIARELSAGFDHVRVDFLYTGDRCALNELSLYDSSGLIPYDPPSFDHHLGDLWVQKIVRA